MADFVGKGRSNYFAVKDEAAFKKWAEDLGLKFTSVFGTGTVMVEAVEEGGGFPNPQTSDGEDDGDRDTAMELAYMLNPLTPFIWQHVGSQTLCYLVGFAFAVAPADEANPYAARSHFRSISIDGIHDLCKEISEHKPTRCEY